MMKSLTEILKARGPSCGVMALRRFRAFKQRIEPAVDRQIEMRDGLLRQREPLGDDAAHGVVRHELVAAGLVHGAHLLIGEALPVRGAATVRGDARLRLAAASTLFGAAFIVVSGISRMMIGRASSAVEARRSMSRSWQACGRDGPRTVRAWLRSNVPPLAGRSRRASGKIVKDTRQRDQPVVGVVSAAFRRAPR